MAEHTEIAWTDATFNPWIGCTKVSPACNSCYAAALDKRAGGYRRKGEPSRSNWGKRAPRHMISEAKWREPLRWERNAAERGSPTLVFCASMADVFEDRSDLDAARARLWDLVEATPHLIWQLLTKRPENVLSSVPHHWRRAWPANAWIGTTVEDQRRADLRLRTLCRIPAPVRFVSFEPLLGRIDLPIDVLVHLEGITGVTPWHGEIDWAIVGGESGPGFRPLNLRHAQDLVDQLQAASIPTLFKQIGGLRPGTGGDELNGRRYQQFPPAAMR